MFFTRTHRCELSTSKKDLINRMVGKHVRIHNIDFEVYEEDGYLHIIPHTEQEESIRTLPVTRVEMIEQGNKTKLITTFKMRQLDAGGPFLIVIFCAFLFIASAVLFFVGASGEQTITYTMLSIGTLIFVLFTYRMQTGYFDYIRKIKGYVTGKSAISNAEMSIPVMQA